MSLVFGDYELLLTFHSFNNHNGRCADDEVCNAATCCEGHPCPNPCNYFFSLCLRPAGTPVSMVHDDGQGNCSALTTGTLQRRISDGMSFTDSVFGISNPIILSGTLCISRIKVCMTVGNFFLLHYHSLLKELSSMLSLWMKILITTIHTS